MIDKSKTTPAFRHSDGCDGTSNKFHHDSSTGTDVIAHFLHHEFRGHILSESTVPGTLITIIDSVGPGSRVKKYAIGNNTSEGAVAANCDDPNHPEAVDVTMLLTSVSVGKDKKEMVETWKCSPRSVVKVERSKPTAHHEEVPRTVPEYVSKRNNQNMSTTK